MSVLSYFDACISGADLNGFSESITGKHVSLLSGLINQKLGKKVVGAKPLKSTFGSFFSGLFDE